MAGGDERLDERGELAAAAAPAVDEVDDRAVAPDVAADLRALEVTVNGSPPGGSGASAPAGAAR